MTSTLAQWAGRANAGEHLYFAAVRALAELKALHRHHYPNCSGGCPADEAMAMLRNAIALAEDNKTDRGERRE